MKKLFEIRSEIKIMKIYKFILKNRIKKPFNTRFKKVFLPLMEVLYLFYLAFCMWNHVISLKNAVFYFIIPNLIFIILILIFTFKFITCNMSVLKLNNTKILTEVYDEYIIIYNTSNNTKDKMSFDKLKEFIIDKEMYIIIIDDVMRFFYKNKFVLGNKDDFETFMIKKVAIKK